MSFEIHSFDPKTADEAAFAALNDLDNDVLFEQDSERRRTPVSDTIARWRHMPSFAVFTKWVVTAPAYDGYVGTAQVAYFEEIGHNQHIAQFDIRIRAPFRRQGVGTRLLGEIASVTAAAQRRLLLGQSTSAVPAGEAFLAHYGFKAGLNARTNQLLMADVDETLLQQWQERARERAADHLLVMWQDSYPDEDIDAIVAMKELMNTAPVEDLDVEDVTLTVDQLREEEASLAARGITRWTLAARHRETGAIGGYTELYFLPSQPEILSQGDTAVVPEVRGKGLGRWLKAAMLVHARETYPGATRIRTGNAASNTAMLKINEELGFRLWKEEKVWQAELDTVRAALDAVGATTGEL